MNWSEQEIKPWRDGEKKKHARKPLTLDKYYLLSSALKMWFLHIYIWLWNVREDFTCLTTLKNSENQTSPGLHVHKHDSRWLCWSVNAAGVG